MPKYLQKRHRTWYAVMEIPKSLRPKFKRARFLQTLKTDSISVAEIKVLPIVAEWKKAIALARSNSSDFNNLLAGIRRLKLEPLHAANLAFDAMLVEHEDTGDVSDETFEAYEVLTEGKVLLSEHIDTYMATQNRLEKKSQDMKRADLVRFTKRFRYADQATQLDLVDWIENSLKNEESLSERTCRRIISHCRGFWVYLIRNRTTDIPLPFTGVVPHRSGPRRASGHIRQPFTPNDYGRLLEGCPAHDIQLKCLIQLGAYTGARIEELCSLRVEDVSQDRFKIINAKTSAGERVVPLHSSIKDLVKNMKDNSDDGFLISGLTSNKYGNRSNALGKRFGRLKSRLEYNRAFVFHSFRKGVATQLEQNGIPENEAARLLGHEFRTMTYGLYSGGNIPFERLKQLIETLCWRN